MKKPYEAPSADVLKFEAQDVITVSGNLNEDAPTEEPGNPNLNPDKAEL